MRFRTFVAIIVIVALFPTAVAQISFAILHDTLTALTSIAQRQSVNGGNGG